MAHAEIEPYAGAIRFWEVDKQYGDPYDWCGSIRWRSKEEVEIGPYDTKITLTAWKEIMKACKEAGVKRILATTYPGGAGTEPRQKWITVK